MKLTMKNALRYCLALSCIGLSPAYAQKAPSKQTFVLNLDYAKFRHTDSSAYVEIYYGFYPGLVTFDARSGMTLGVLKVSTRVTDLTTGDLRVNMGSTVLIPPPDTNKRGGGSVMISQSGYSLPIREYRLEAKVVDSLAPSRGDSLSIPISIRAHGQATWLSDLELCSSVKNSTRTDDLYYKNSLEVIPNPTLIFGAATHPVMFNYSEIYNLDTTQTYTLKTQVVAGDGKV